MKKSLFLLVVTLMTMALLSACGGGAAPEAPAEVPAVVEEAVEEASEAVVEAEAPDVAEPADAPAEEAAPADAPAEEAAPDTAADVEPAAAGSDLAMSGIDPDTGLEINPPVTEPGVDYIVRGTLASYNLIPQDSPEFLVETPGGVRFRIRSQALSEIFVTDGTQILPHQFTRGLPIQATARLTESDRATSVMESTNLVILSPTP